MSEPTNVDEGLAWRTRLPELALDDVAAIAVVVGLAGICGVVWVMVGWWAGLGLFFLLLVVWGLVTLEALRRGHHGIDLAAAVANATVEAQQR